MANPAPCQPRPARLPAAPRCRPMAAVLALAVLAPFVLAGAAAVRAQSIGFDRSVGDFRDDWSMSLGIGVAANSTRSQVPDRYAKVSTSAIQPDLRLRTYIFDHGPEWAFLHAAWRPRLFGDAEVEADDPTLPGLRRDYQDGLSSGVEVEVAAGVGYGYLTLSAGVSYSSTHVEETATPRTMLRLFGFPFRQIAGNDGDDAQGMRSFNYDWWGPYLEVALNGHVPAPMGTGVSFRMWPLAMYEFRGDRVNTQAFALNFSVAYDDVHMPLYASLEIGWLSSRRQEMSNTVWASLSIGIAFA